MFGRVLNISLPAKERKDIRNASIKTIDRLVFPKAVHACSDHFTLNILTVYIRLFNNKKQLKHVNFINFIYARFCTDSFNTFNS